MQRHDGSEDSLCQPFHTSALHQVTHRWERQLSRGTPGQSENHQCLGCKEEDEMLTRWRVHSMVQLMVL